MNQSWKIIFLEFYAKFVLGLGCNEECSAHGKCTQELCVCDEINGWRGTLCEVFGCPGIGKDCSGHGTCNSADRTCICNPG